MRAGDGDHHHHGQHWRQRRGNRRPCGRGAGRHLRGDVGFRLHPERADRFHPRSAEQLVAPLQALGLQGDQVLADGNIRYRRPVAMQPEARCVLQQCNGDLTPLANGRKVQQQIRVGIYSAGELAAEFEGRYAVLPHKTTS